MKLSAALLAFATVQVVLVGLCHTYKPSQTDEADAFQSAPWVKLNPSQTDEVDGSHSAPWENLKPGPSIHDAAPFGYAALACGYDNVSVGMQELKG
jgi:hypothetical protein